MDAFIKVNKKDPQVLINLRSKLDKCVKLSLNYQSKLGYDTLIQKVILEEIINLINFMRVNKDRQLKKNY